MPRNQNIFSPVKLPKLVLNGGDRQCEFWGCETLWFFVYLVKHLARGGKNWRLRQTVLTEPHRGLVLRAYLQTPPWSGQIWLRIRWAELLEGESQKPQLRKSQVKPPVIVHTHTHTHNWPHQDTLKAGWPHLKKAKDLNRHWTKDNIWRASEYMKRCLVPLIIRNCNTIKYYWILVVLDLPSIK